MFTNNFIMSLISHPSKKNDEIKSHKIYKRYKHKHLEESDYGTSALCEAEIISQKDISYKQEKPKVYIESRIKFDYEGKECVLKIRHPRYIIK